MKQTPQQQKIQSNFNPGRFSKDGFLGQDDRHIHDIIKADQLTIARLGIDQYVIAERLQYFIEQGKKGLDNEIDLDDYTIKVVWSRGKLVCPFGDPGVHNKILATVYNKRLNKIITFSQLNVHLIKEHCFFEGRGSKYRLEPDELINVLKIK